MQRLANTAGKYGPYLSDLKMREGTKIMNDEKVRPIANSKLKFVLSGIIAGVLLLIAGASVARNVVIGKLKESDHQSNVASAHTHLLALCTDSANLGSHLSME